MDSSINISRDEFETLRREVADVRHLVERTRVILHGENGDNGLRSSIERAHKAISDLRNNLKMVHDAVSQLTFDSASGDKDMQLMVVQELQRLERQMQERADVERRWKIGQTIALALGLAGVLLRLL